MAAGRGFIVLAHMLPRAISPGTGSYGFPFLLTCLDYCFSESFEKAVSKTLCVWYFQNAHPPGHPNAGQRPQLAPSSRVQLPYSRPGARFASVPPSVLSLPTSPESHDRCPLAHLPPVAASVHGPVTAYLSFDVIPSPAAHAFPDLAAVCSPQQHPFPPLGSSLPCQPGRSASAPGCSAQAGSSPSMPGAAAALPGHPPALGPQLYCCSRERAHALPAPSYLGSRLGPKKYLHSLCLP